jgi:hypothetical protein
MLGLLQLIMMVAVIGIGIVTALVIALFFVWFLFSSSYEAFDWIHKHVHASKDEQGDDDER